jgi:hypothetical protein
MSQVVGMRPDLFTAYLHCSSRWDGAFAPVAQTRVPVYFVVGQGDEYYGAEPAQEAYDSLHSLYEQADCPIRRLTGILVLDIKDADYFRDGVPPSAGGGYLFAQNLRSWAAV